MIRKYLFNALLCSTFFSTSHFVESITSYEYRVYIRIVHIDILKEATFWKEVILNIMCSQFIFIRDVKNVVEHRLRSVYKYIFWKIGMMIK